MTVHIISVVCITPGLGIGTYKTLSLFLGLGMLVFGRVRSSRLKHWVRTLFDWRYDRKQGAENLPDKSDEKERVPFGVAIALGTVLALIYAYYVETPA